MESDSESKINPEVDGYPAWIWTDQPLNPAMLTTFLLSLLFGVWFTGRCAGFSRKAGSPPPLPNSPEAEFRADSGFFSVVRLSLLTIPCVSLLVIPVQSWHLFVVPYDTYGPDFTNEAIVQTITFTVKLLILFAPLLSYWLLQSWTPFGLRLAKGFFMAFPVFLVSAAFGNSLQHPYPNSMLLVSAMEMTIATAASVVCLPYLFGSTRLRAAFSE